MAKPPLYAPVEAAAAVAAMLIAASICLSAASPQQGEPCATCIAIAVTPETVFSLPAELGGLDVFVRSSGDPATAANSLAEIERRGGRPSLFVTSSEAGAVKTAMAGARRILLEPSPRAPAESDEQFAFRLKTSLTALRAAAGEATLIGLVADSPAVSSLGTRDLGSYVDFVGMSSDRTPPHGIEAWRIVAGDAIDLDAVLARTRKGGATRWLWILPAGTTVAAADASALVRALSVPSAHAASPDTANQFGQHVDVVASRALTVEEIVARHQAAAARQRGLVRTVIASGSLTLSFEAPGFPAPVTVSSRVTLYTSPETTDIEQQDVRINGVQFRGSAVPRLPIIEPERVASPPLAIALTDVYRYRLEGRDRIGSTPCYVVSFEPDPERRDPQASLFRGRAWIAADSFAMIKVAAAQTRLRGAIVASEQVDDFREAQPGIWLLARSDVRQMYEGAAHRTPIHRVLAIQASEVNPQDFAGRRQRAYTSSSIMLRDTPQGYRYLKKASARVSDAPPTVAPRADRVRTIAAGVIVDPNISVPLPFAGVSYVDFNLFGTGAQLNTFFGGTYGQLAFSVPSVRGGRWQVAGRAFAIASSYNDRAFVAGRERYDEDIRQRPAQASIWLLRPLGPRVSFRAGYDLDYTHLSAGTATAREFVVPADQVVHGARLSLDLQRDGWNASAWWNPARRSGWRGWGRAAGDYRSSQRDFQRYGVTVSRAHVINPRLVARIEAAWMDGRDLDRFSRYSFGTFDNRLRGYPSALIRYDRGGVLRTAIAWASSRLVRLDGFVDSAEVHDPGFGAGLRNYTGVGGAIEVPSPFGTLLAIEWGYGWRGVNSNGTLGTQVVRVSGYKVF